MWVIFVIASLLISSDVWALVEIPPCVAMVKPLDSSNYVGSTQDFKHGFSTLYRDRYTDTSSNYFEGIGGHPGVDIFQDSQGEHLTTSTPVQAICAGIVERVTENGKKNNCFSES